MTLRHLILDRDGVLNHENAAGGWVSDPEDWRWLPGVLSALARLREAGVRVSVVTNQSCIGRGLASREDVDRVNDRMTRECLEAGGRIDGVFVCPHAPGAGCSCRKPRPGLVEEAVAESRLPADSTVLVGDDERDLKAGLEAGVAVSLVLTGKGALTEARLAVSGIPVHDDLGAAVASLLASKAQPIGDR